MRHDALLDVFHHRVFHHIFLTQILARRGKDSQRKILCRTTRHHYQQASKLFNQLRGRKIESESWFSRVHAARPDYFVVPPTRHGRR